MVRKWQRVLIGAIVLAVVPALSQAQTANGAKLGSRENPIPVTKSDVTVPASKAKPKAKTTAVKRGTKTNPIAGQTHPRGTHP